MRKTLEFAFPITFYHEVIVSNDVSLPRLHYEDGSHHSTLCWDQGCLQMLWKLEWNKPWGRVRWKDIWILPSQPEAGAQLPSCAHTEKLLILQRWTVLITKVCLSHCRFPSEVQERVISRQQLIQTVLDISFRHLSLRYRIPKWGILFVSEQDSLNIIPDDVLEN